MKQLHLITIIAVLLLSLHSFAQTNLQIGVQAVISKTKGWGPEIVGNVYAARNLSIGIGTRPIKFEERSKLYVPVFATIKYYYPLPKYKLFASIDPGYGIYNAQDFIFDSFPIHRTGAVYLSGSISIAGNSKLAPYASIHFTKYGFTEHDYFGSRQYRPISTFTFSAGIMLNRSARQSIFNHKKDTAVQQKPIVVLGPNDYLKKSKRQKTTARILLGTGVGLIAGGIILANQTDEPIYQAISLVYVGGSGVISSLVSIPFFNASARNKRKAEGF